LIGETVMSFPMGCCVHETYKRSILVFERKKMDGMKDPLRYRHTIGKEVAVHLAAERYWEIDFARGIAVIMMVAFHTAFDLDYFRVVNNGISSGQWRLFAVCTASLFLLLVGLSLTISSARAKGVLDDRAYTLKFIRRGAGIFALGLLITIVTLFFVPDAPILFGILHLIGVSLILAPLFLPYKWMNLAAGLVLIAVGSVTGTIDGPSLLLWIGIHPATFSSLDYTPLVPWLGVVLVGVFAGKVLYPDGKRRFGVPEISFFPKNEICFLGRHSLAIYLLHQPAILLVIFLFWGLPGIL